jgi:periplasmic protein TonB
MRIGVFLLLSLALHATALTYPVFFPAPQVTELLPVTVLDLDNAGGGDGAGRGEGEGSNKRQVRSKQAERIERRVQTNGAGKTAPRENHSNVAIDFTAVSITGEGVVVAPNQNDGTGQQAGSASFAGFAEDTGHGKGNAAGFAGGTGYGTGGIGYGNGNGTGSDVTTARPVGVTYAYSPKPEYPDSARKEGHEGTVVLRVLVDEKGRSKSLGVDRSSGFQTLDKAALNAVRDWRFNAARHGDQPVESWVKIPIVFRLADFKD